ncbi:28S ribosomal protein S18c, mitochondrial isoform X3 [Varanus komodoensis]|uniref:28S ribosomal protein S18c, mitochondrial isoform X3 n=1 Tax=Varanus komodoensis TaxID=61221 RepID=UPI001CF787B1|nr:28S ribosomal protein S18c, mitochondrial isoform X3 [Varanus komodoensis]
MAGMACLIAPSRGSGRLCYILSGVRKAARTSGTGTRKEILPRSGRELIFIPLTWAVIFCGLREACLGDKTTSWTRECSSHTDQVSSKTDMPVPMENPYKEPPKRCILCGITVDYKNIQLLSQFISPYTGRIFGMHITVA